MYYIKDKQGNELELGEEKTFAKCGYCRKEMEVEFDDIDDFYGTTHHCTQIHAEMDTFMYESLITELMHRYEEFAVQEKTELTIAIHKAIRPYLGDRYDE